MFLQLRNLATYAHGADGSLPSNIRVRCGKEILDFRKEVSGHLDRRNVAECAEGESDNVLVRVTEITASSQPDQI
jgi:hypothetical protein